MDCIVIILGSIALGPSRAHCPTDGLSLAFEHVEGPIAHMEYICLFKRAPMPQSIIDMDCIVLDSMAIDPSKGH